MMRVLAIIPLLLCCAYASAQELPALSGADLGEQLAVLRVARTLKLRQDQVDQLKPWLQQIREARDKRLLALDALAEGGIPAITNVDKALMADRKAAKADLNTADSTAREHRAAFAATDKVVEAAVDAAFKVLDKNQTRLVETRAQQQARTRDAARYAGASSLAEYLTGYASAMRKLEPDEYDVLRSAMGLRLAGLLVAPRDPRYNAAVAGVLRVLDGVRRMSDAEYAQGAASLAQTVARALGLPAQAAVVQQAISYDDFSSFISSEGTLAALAVYKPAPPLEVVP